MTSRNASIAATQVLWNSAIIAMVCRFFIYIIQSIVFIIYTQLGALRKAALMQLTLNSATEYQKKMYQLKLEHEYNK
jgi:hypothetical protein